MISIPNKEEHARARNVLGGPLEPCSKDPMTGFYRTGCCETGPDDQGRHVVCIVATESFLEFSRAAGNDLATPMPEYGFPGIKPVTSGASVPPAGSRRSMPGVLRRWCSRPPMKQPWN